MAGRDGRLRHHASVWAEGLDEYLAIASAVGALERVERRQLFGEEPEQFLDHMAVS
jgi:hypothetical protein